MKYAQIFAIGTILAMLSLLVGGGCSTTGNGRLDIDAGAAIKAAAAGASGDYAKAMQEIAKAVQKKKEASIQLDAAMKSAGFSFARAMYFDGALIEDESRFSKREWWERVTVGEKAVAANGSTNAAEGAANADDDALAGEIADILTDLGLARE